MNGRFKAETINQKGTRLLASGQLEEARLLFEQAASIAPRWSMPLYNLGLLFKKQRAWEKSLEFNLRATKIDRKDQAAWWNLGIAATALGRWDVARSAWRGFGINVPNGEGPIDFPCGACPIRINPDGAAEVVWANRIDPARAELFSIPFPESNHRWRDKVLNNGAPVGHRKIQGKEVPVFNEIELLEPSKFGTFVARVTMPPADDVGQQLADIASRLEGCAEDWSTSVRMVCKACSEGRPHQAHDAEAAPVEGAHILGIAAENYDHAMSMVARWKAEFDGILIESVEAALEPKG